MIEKEFFIRPLNTDISVATIGISRDDWYCHRPGMTRDEVRETMVRGGFDVVPILDKKGVFKRYFSLNEVDNSRLDCKEITTEDKLYYLTHVRDSVWKMKSERRTHYFLTNGRNEDDVVGLLSLSNYNCREFYVFLFSLMSYVEREFAFLIDSDKETGFKILRGLAHTKELADQWATIENRIDQDMRKQNENDYKEYLYLHHLVCLVEAEKKYKKLGYQREHDFETGTSGLRDLRNNIAHPVRSLVRNLNDLDNLDAGLRKLYEFKGRLDNYLKQNGKSRVGN